VVPINQPVNSPWETTPAPWPEVINQRVVLALRPLPDETPYVVRTGWAETVAGYASRNWVEKTVRLRVAQAGDNALRLRLRLQDVRLVKRHQSAFDDLAELLAGLYADLVLDASPTGELRGLANHEEIRRTWQRLRQELARRYPVPSEVVAALVAGIDQQLAQPSSLAPSLPLDYLYAALPGCFYQQPFETNSRYARPRAFPEFFDGLALHFTETLRLAPLEVLTPAAEPPAPVLHLTGTLDGTATDVGAVAARIQATLGTAHAVRPEDLRLTYEATHRFAKNTGWPTAVALTVRCAYQDMYDKEYHLTLHQLPA